MAFQHMNSDQKRQTDKIVSSSQLFIIQNVTCLQVGKYTHPRTRN